MSSWGPRPEGDFQGQPYRFRKEFIFIVIDYTFRKCFLVQALFDLYRRGQTADQLLSD